MALVSPATCMTTAVEKGLNDQFDTTGEEEAPVVVPVDQKAAVRLWLRLLGCTTLVEAELRRQFRIEFDFTVPRFEVMAQLDRRPGGMMLGELAKSLMVSAGNVTPIIERLIADALVVRASTALDRRVQIVSLTIKGRQKFRRMANRNAQITASIFHNLSPQQIETLTVLLGDAKRAVLQSRDDMRQGGPAKTGSRR